MAIPAEPDRPGRLAALLGRLRRVRWVLIAAVLVLLLLAAAGRLSFLEMLALFACIAVAALIGAGERAPIFAGGPAGGTVGSERAEAALAALIEALPDAAYLLDRRGTILTGNGRAAALHGPVRLGELVWLRVRTPQLVEAIRLTAADGTSRRVEFVERVPVDRQLEVHVIPVAAEPARPAELVLLVFRDLTQQHLVEQMRVDFVANASHELRTPLASLSGFIDTLRGPAREDAPARDRFLDIMADQARRMSRLIEDLLSLSRIELNEHIQPKGTVDLVPIVAHVCDSLGPLARERGVKVEIKRAAERLPMQGDRDELIRLFENLVENALKYGASGKRVEITLAAEGGEAVVSVRDFGPGIAPEHVPRLTERFYRVDVETSRAQGGTGLGLAIVKHILARHRGRLAIDSALGHGAMFTVRFELASE